MRKFRYADPRSSLGRNRVIRQVVTFLIGWNVIGVVLYKSMKSKQREKDPDFDTKTSSQQILSMMGYQQSQIQKFRYKVGTGGIERVKPEDTPDTKVSQTHTDEAQS